eukprot:TRINITY_DN15058_c0_g1_i2.p1 TRINITY_DN15058_c0_g1~~TRINITY_DN15058_c0_g1_i2.p1  ORF type:complete len:386 (+),score=91.84 TRINITY_DN15058_c0_g1_i2:122-1279(+)
MNIAYAPRRALVIPSSAKYSTKRKRQLPARILKEEVKTRKAKVMEAYRKRGRVRLKDKHGNNIKQHFGIWKYFIHASTAVKEKFYISLDCQKFKGFSASKVAKRDKAMKHEYIANLKSIRTEEDIDSLGYWGIPYGICLKFDKLFHIKKLYPWQSECLSLAIPSRANLIYSVPTSGGKSLVAEIVMLRAVLIEKRRALYVLPYISLVAEKAEYLKKITEDINAKIEQFHGLGNAMRSQLVDNIWSPNVDVALATPEKANSILNRLVEECNLDITYVIIDEFHLIAEPNRGGQIEVLLAKILALEKMKGVRVQVVAMTATISQLEVYSNWMQASMYENVNRPTPLTEYVLCEEKLLNSSFEEVGSLTSKSKNETVCQELSVDSNVG